MIEDSASIPGYTILKEEPGDVPQTLSGHGNIHPLGKMPLQNVTCQ